MRCLRWIRTLYYTSAQAVPGDMNRECPWKELYRSRTLRTPPQMRKSLYTSMCMWQKSSVHDASSEQLCYYLDEALKFSHQMQRRLPRKDAYIR